MAREWTVKLSGPSFLISSSVFSTSSLVSCGSPTMMSILILSKPSSLASKKASFTCKTVCLRPISSNVSSFIVCGLILIRVTGWRFIVLSFSRVMLSGRPASTVHSWRKDKLKEFSIFERRRSNWSGSNVVGVPPPIYIVFSFLSLKASAT